MQCEILTTSTLKSTLPLSPLDLLDSPCSVAHLLIVAKKGKFDWKVVGRRLLDPQDIDDIDRDERSEQSKRDTMLLRWKELKGSCATYKALMGVFEEIGNHHGAEMVKKLISPIAEGRCCHCSIVL